MGILCYRSVFAAGNHRAPDSERSVMKAGKKAYIAMANPTAPVQ
ncbi:MAG: hypothetical protein PHT58_08830 [Eubacteriales bacterium]|nr:hypothetical protein [Eubacteriales bacterium]